MSGKRKRLYYRLTPIFEPDPNAPPMISTAAIVTCIATGQMLSGHGGGADALSPEIVDQLDMRKTGGAARVICDGNTFDEMVEALREALEYVEYSHIRQRLRDVLSKATGTEGWP